MLSNIWKAASLVLGVSLLAACTTTSLNPVVVRQTPLVIEPPATYYNCPTLDKYPNPATLTNRQLANVIVSLDRNNRICKENIISIEQYVRQAKEAIPTS